MKFTGLLVLFTFFYLAAAAQKPYWQQQVNYTIRVTLNDTEHTLDGYEVMEYVNNSEDTLRFIWIHLWANAYKNDRTAFTDQALENGSTDFYFSEAEQRGYINRLSFTVNGQVALMEDHPQHQDILKVHLPVPLPPKKSCTIETPFHVKLPYNFSRGGHVGQSYQITQWYPKAAVYDRKGWHEIPYLDQGEFYSDFGNYEVAISLPENYIIAATGELTKDSSHPATTDTTTNMEVPVKKQKKPFFPEKKKPQELSIPSSRTLKTVVYKQKDVIDFAWFADKRFTVKKDTLALPSGRVISIAAYSLPETAAVWKDAVKYIKKATLTRSVLVGEYPYNTVTVVEAKTKYAGGMEYPTITLLTGIDNQKDLESVTEHEVGHNWFYAILASNERLHPWMDEGMNEYYKNRYSFELETAAPRKKSNDDFWKQRIPADLDDLLWRHAAAQRKDQPIETTSEKFSARNYSNAAYHAASEWMLLLERTLGTGLFDKCMRAYYEQWKFKHPYPEDFKAVLETVSQKNLDTEFALLSMSKKGKKIISRQTTLLAPFDGNIPAPYKRKTTLTSFFSLQETDKYRYIALSPLLGYNRYDRLMVGLAVHNYTLPAEKFQFFAAPLYATGSKQINGIGTLNYHWFPASGFQKIEIGINGSRFSSNQSLDTTGKKVFENFYRAVPYIRIHFKQPARGSGTSYIDLRSFIIGDRRFDNFGYAAGSDSAFTYPKSFSNSTRYINQASFVVENSRVLYPYQYQLQLQQGNGFYRINASGNYFFNYAKGGGMQVRLFAAKFGFVGAKNVDAYLYQPKLLAGNGTDDYTNSHYFIGRSASTAFGDIPVKNSGLAAQQVMIQNTGGLKLRLDPYSSVQGYSENWVAAVNFSTTLPEKLFPVKLPLKIFFDAGSYSEAWGKNAFTPRFLYVGGLQLSLFKNVLNIYAPLIYSTAFKDQLKTDPDANKFFRKLTFSIDIQNIRFKNLFPQFSL